MSDYLQKQKKLKNKEKKEGLSFSSIVNFQIYSKMSDNFYKITNRSSRWLRQTNWRGSVHARISYYLTYIALTVSDCKQNCACSCTFPSMEGTYLRHDPCVERISSRHATHENYMNHEREFPNLLLKNSISRSVSDDNWTSMFFNPVDLCKCNWHANPRSIQNAFARNEISLSDHVLAWKLTRRRIKNEKKITQYRKNLRIIFCE